MAKVNLNVVILDENDQEMTTTLKTKVKKKKASDTQEFKEDEVDFTFARAINSSLLSQLPEDTDPKTGRSVLSGEKKDEIYSIYFKIKEAKDGIVDLKLDEIELIKERVAMRYPALISGQIWASLKNL